MLEGKTTIVHQELISLASVDYVKEGGFFFRTKDGGTITYCLYEDKNDNQAIQDTFNASEKFDNPAFARKIFKSGTAATNIIIGEAV
jgi:hypothetical protein